MLLVKVHESRDRNVHLVAAPHEVGLADLLLVGEALGGLVVLYLLVGWVRNGLERLLVIVPEHPFLEHFNTLHALQSSGDDLDGRVLQRNYVPLDRVLLHIVYSDPDVRALRDLIFFQFTKPDENIHVGTPKIDEEQKGVEENGRHEAQYWHELLAIEYLATKVVVKGKDADADG